MYYLGSPGSSPRKKEIYQAQSSMTIASSDSSKAMSPSQSTEDGLLIKPMMLIVCVQSYLTLSNPMIHSPPGSSAHGIFQARILQWVAISSSRGSSQPRYCMHISCISCIGRWVLYHCAIWEARFSCKYLHIYFFRFFSLLSYCKILSIVPCAVQ